MSDLAKRRPNVVVFLTDQQRWDTSSYYGNPLGLTPNYDDMAVRGTHCYNAFTCQPVCGPARSCLQTGKYATNTGVFKNGLGIKEDEKTLAYYFNNAGYHTGYIGKWHLRNHIGRKDYGDPVPPECQGGYQYWLGANVLEFCSTPYDTIMFDKDGKSVKLPGYRTDALADAAINYINANQNHPFFLCVSFLEPHQQNHNDSYQSPDSYKFRYEGRWMPPDLMALGGNAHASYGGYCGMVKRLDEALGRINDALKSLELADDTIIAYTSDHGCHFKTRNAEYKRSCHDSSIRIPMAFSGPGFNHGGRLYEMISLLDVTPTLLDAADIEVPESMEGRSIMPLIRGQAVEWPEEVFVQISEDKVSRAVRTHKWKYSVTAFDKDPITDSGSLKYTEEFLYDIEADRHELTNLAGMESYRSISKILRDKLVEKMAQAGEDKPLIELAVSKSSGQRKLLSNFEKNNVKKVKNDVKRWSYA
jgi:arylsulfatase A-like enzyme